MSVIQSDEQLAQVVEDETKFIKDSRLDTDTWDQDAVLEQSRQIEYFLNAYENTDQDTVIWAPEFVVVTRMLLQGKRPVKLKFLTDFEGEDT